MLPNSRTKKGHVVLNQHDLFDRCLSNHRHCLRCGASLREAHLKVGENKTIEYITPKDNTSQQCPIPNYFYKVVLKVNKSGDNVTSASTIGFWFEHKDYDNSTYVNYAVSVDEIEARTGFDFFVNLPDSVEARAETNASWSTFQNF